MTPVLIAVIVVVAVVISIVSARRALAERDVVERQQQTLDLLGTVAGRSIATHLPDDGLDSRYQPRHGTRRRPPAPWRTVTTVGLVLAVGLVVILAGFLLLRPKGHPAASAPPPQPAATTTTTVAPTTTSTTVVTPAVVLVSSSAQQASYKVQGAAADVELEAVAPCWVEIRSQLGHGSVVFAGVLLPGTQQPVVTAASGGGVSVRLADPANMSVWVDGANMALPSVTGSRPYTLLFESAS